MDFTPAVYEHAAALLGCSPWEVSRDEDLLVRAQEFIKAESSFRPTRRDS